MTRTQKNNKISQKQIKEFRGQILDWYDANRRELPWRAVHGEKPDPYHVWLSEIMLQQTTVAAVIPYYMKFLRKWPDIHALAAAKQDEVLSEWAGLGYYARARNLYKCAELVVNDLGGRFPEDQKALKALPGIGDYTSAAIRTIAFSKPAVVMDGNIERIAARYFAVKEPLPKSKPQLKAFTMLFFEDYKERPGDLAQALMDLGATICTPQSPKCSFCPVSQGCKAREQGVAEKLPAKIRAKTKPQKHGNVYWITDAEGRVLLHKRPETGMLGGMIGLPTSEWRDKKKPVGHIELAQDNDITFKSKGIKIYHSFTHYDLELALYEGKSHINFSDTYFWLERDKIEDVGFASLFKKALRAFRV